MQQIVQKLNRGELRIVEVPEPIATPGQIVIANVASVISAGTEKAVRNLAQKSLLNKARERPDQVRRVLQKLRQEGILKTYEQVQSKLSQPTPLGYSSSGIVLACGSGVQGFRPGDRVASNGPHAEVVSVAKNLCAVVPDSVSHEHAAFTVIGAIALQGVRLSKLALGETAFVIGLGLVGQIAVSLLRAAGCRVVGTDLESSKCELALSMGAAVARPRMSEQEILELTGGLGADAVLITAATTSSEPIRLAGEAVRKKGRVIVVGAVGMEVPRPPFYEKEAELVVSCSYGPGRYDPLYEERGQDYPAPYVRWTEQRNMQAVLGTMAETKLDVSPLISHRFPVAEAEAAYELIQQESEPYLGVVLNYSEATPEPTRRTIELKASLASTAMGVGCIGAGAFATSVLLPAIKKVDRLRPQVLCTARGLSAVDRGEQFGFARATSDEDSVFTDAEVGVVFLLTRHDLHAEQVIRAISAGKHVFVEKPLALTVDELVRIREALANNRRESPILMVGFNRRFSPAAQRLKKAFEGVTAPLSLSYRFNAGTIEPDQWPQDELIGGGRIIGEACHAIDLATYLHGSPPVRVFADSIGGPNAPPVTDDQCFITLRHANGAISSIGYLAGGDRAFPKERIEVFGGGRVGVIDDFREVITVVGGKTRRSRGLGQDKGHSHEIEKFAESVTRGGAAPIPWGDLWSVSLAAILAARCLREGMPFDIPRSNTEPVT